MDIVKKFLKGVPVDLIVGVVRGHLLGSLKNEKSKGYQAAKKELVALAGNEAERHAAMMNAMAQNTKTLLGFQSQMAGVFDAQRQASAEMVLLLRDINNNTRP